MEGKILIVDDDMAFVCYYMKCSKRRLSDIPSDKWISSFRYREKDNQI